MTSEQPSRISILRDKNDERIILDTACNPSWYATNKNDTTVNSAPSGGSGSVGVSSIIGLILFFGLIIYSV
jgi:hypothetical protein